MADTRIYKTKVEDYVREVLRAKYSVGFKRRKLKLPTGGLHEFDAVGEDEQNGRIVAGIKSSAGKNSLSGKIKSVEAELYYLTLVEAGTKLLVLTDREFHGVVKARLKCKVPQEIKVCPVELRGDLQKEVDAVRKKARDEMSPP